MYETMYLENGIGLAAPQVGELIRVVVIDIPIADPIDPSKQSRDAIALINPEIKHGEGLIQFEEGCLSCPELIVKVDRFNKIQVAYQNLEGQACQLETDGLKAVCIQHEIDHLNGVLLVDKMSRLERDVYRNQRIRIAKEESELPIL